MTTAALGYPTVLDFTLAFAAVVDMIMNIALVETYPTLATANHPRLRFLHNTFAIDLCVRPASFLQTGS